MCTLVLLSTQMKLPVIGSSTVARFEPATVRRSRALKIAKDGQMTGSGEENRVALISRDRKRDRIVEAHYP